MAADHAADAFGVQEAIALCTSGIEALERSKQDNSARKEAELREKKAALYMLVSDFDSAHMENEQVAEIARRLANPAQKGSALAGMAFASVLDHKFERSLSESNRAVEIGRALGSNQILAASKFSTGFVQMVTGHLVEARKNSEQAYELSQSTGDAYHQSMSNQCLSYLENWQGDYPASAFRAKDALEIARNHNLAFPHLTAPWSLALPLTAKGDYDDGHALLLEGLALAEKLGDEIFRNRILNTLGWLHAECGSLERAIEFNQKGIGPSRERGDPETMVNCELNLGDTFLAKGDRALAREYFDAAHTLAGNPSTSDRMKWRYSLHLFVGYGETCLAMDDVSRAEAFANQCLELATHTDSRKYLARGWRLKGEIAIARTNWEDAEAALEKALAFAERTGNPTQPWKTHLARVRLYQETQRVDQGRGAANVARATLDSIGQRLQTPELKAGFNESPLFRSNHNQCAID